MLYVWGIGDTRTGFWWGPPAGKRPFGRPKRRWEGNTKMDLQEVGWVVDKVDVLRIKQVAGSCERGNEPSGSIKCGEFLD